ncbi:MAG: hypothetical protein J6M55_01310, partial [Paludibacteraceae bacterium]|nr:hypothetical protein [Paludibacteraceae bacterium]
AQGRGREAAEPRTHSIADGTALRYIVGEEVAATFGDTEDLSPRALFADTIRSTRAQTQFG